MAVQAQRLIVNEQGNSVCDAIGNTYPQCAADARIVSLVPSVTELLCDLNLTAELVGRTGFCIHPKDKLKTVAKVGGTKNVNLDKVRELKPTHAIVNIDENREELYHELISFVPNVFVTHPTAPRDNIDLYLGLGALFNRTREADALVREFQRKEQALARLENPDAQTVLYLIWKDPWMAVNADTYISEMLRLINWKTVCGDSKDRYPEVILEEFAGKVDRVLLSTEPYSFKDKHCIEVATMFPANTQVNLVDGEMLSWYGSRAIAGLDYLESLVK